jgi:membrane-associated phospholipid phosphatase
MYLSLFRFAPVLLVFITVLLQSHVYLYLIGCLLTMSITYLLKGILQEPRPPRDHTVRYGNDQFGCPSGHSSSVWYSTLFVLLVLRNHYLFLFYLLVSCLTMYQRVVFHHHTIHQVLVGAIVGSLIAVVIAIGIDRVSLTWRK